MDEHHCWYIGSVWHKDWPHQGYAGQWPIFYGPVILLHILKTIWWRNVVLGIMDQCDTKIDLLKYICGSVTYISWSIDFAFYYCHRLKLFVYIQKWRRPRVFVPLQTLALVYFQAYPHQSGERYRTIGPLVLYCHRMVLDAADWLPKVTLHMFLMMMWGHYMTASYEGSKYQVSWQTDMFGMKYIKLYKLFFWTAIKKLVYTTTEFSNARAFGFSHVYLQQRISHRIEDIQCNLLANSG